ncbi:bifunctional pyridoxamine 5'-phosphate oxidase family protein/GNAT family N-acetyltransferase [Hamadaea tsunoensis]|uniref:bifunctional pyridoxamine 5'-phosphate oxidase family protein/GNAT family N-acetyltransferase n=1 Tax=Hamadaea tsunoensis TaxID=53368 RepID=UPI00041C0CE5|nr:bifunctional pyridoxamine 5'-phosphate oxidase family protein/GNAT family N-acetyltransferase [Hamadaea tsunoensis]
MRYNREEAYALLDEAWTCTVSFVLDGQPRALPTLYVRIGDHVYIHFSTGSRIGLGGRDGLPVCLSVTQLDALILARSQFHHSANYRSLVAHGVAELVADPDERSAAFTALTEKVGPGRSAHTRPPSAKEAAQTAVLRLPLDEVSVRTRTGGVNEEPEDLALPYWAGVVPMRSGYGRPEPDKGVTAPLPDYLRRPPSPWHEAPTLTGEHVILERLTMDHVEGLYAAVGQDDDVWRYLLNDTPRSLEEMGRLVGDAEIAQAQGARVPWVQRDAETGEIVGTTSFYGVDPHNRSVIIGITTLGRKWWRTGINTESKLLLLRHAFDTLGCVRVQWEAHAGNVRSHTAIERLGATREGLLRNHKKLSDGTWRDTVVFGMTAEEWPKAEAALVARLRPRAS